MAQSQGDKCEPGPRGHVCIVPVGADVNVRVTSTDVRIQIYDKGGTTIGNAFITDRKEAAQKAPLLDHELFHTFQWAAAGGLPFAALYGAEYAKAGGECNRFEQAAGFAAGGYDECVGSP